MTLRVRLAKPDDMGFVLDAWRRSYEGSPAVRGCEREHYRIEMTRAIRRLCDRAEVRIACDPADEDTIVGFVAFTGNELHYAYTKQDFRGMGVAKQLLEGAHIDAYTFRSNNARPPAGWAYKPRFTIDPGHRT
jgi:GNAT superfamily N-acetyltransferase